ncbi:hypothetical protein [Hymenobacter nivis]|uniref:hypothetical protein n=1 Tax=Hymenobacter nivis TaxID=1850093 RepID=UPI001477433D|nr:hypothetical protein [Hymenobacter nivis]
MVALKRFVSVVVLVYLLLALLFLLVPAVQRSVSGLGSAADELTRDRNFFQLLATIGAVVLAVQLLVESLDSSLLRRTVAKQDGRINELKANLYDQQQANQQRANQQQANRPAAFGGGPGGPIGPGAPGGGPGHYGGPTAPPAPQRPIFPQHDPSLPNTPSAERPPL